MKRIEDSNGWFFYDNQQVNMLILDTRNENKFSDITFFLTNITESHRLWNDITNIQKHKKFRDIMLNLGNTTNFQHNDFSCAIQHKNLIAFKILHTDDTFTCLPVTLYFTDGSEHHLNVPIEVSDSFINNIIIRVHAKEIKKQ